MEKTENANTANTLKQMHTKWTYDDDGYCIRENHKTDWICHHCGNAYLFRADFEDHNSIRHNDEKPYYCDYKGCNKSYGRKGVYDVTLNPFIK